MKPFRVNAQWVDYAHGPGSDDGQQLACALVTLPESADGVMLVSDPDLVAEIVSVAGLYTHSSDVQQDDRLWWRAYPAQVIRRGKSWLFAHKQEQA